MKHLYSFVIACNIFFVPTVAVSNTPAPSEPLDVGALLCLTGNCSDWGTAALKGAQLAAKEINAGGGVLGRQINLIV